MNITWKTVIKLFLYGCVFVSAVLFCACEASVFTYDFKNDTPYGINVYVNQNYTLVGKDGASDTDKPKNEPIYLGGKGGYNPSSAEITVDGSSSLDFYWKPAYSSDNGKIYSKVSGGSVTFKETGK